MRLVLLALIFFVSNQNSLFCQRLFEPQFFEKQEFAHRGGYYFGTENTLETFQIVLDKGHRAFEIDIQRTKDNVLIIFHDDDTKRLLESNVNYVISETNWSVLSKIPLKDQSQGTVFIPTLDQLIEFLNSQDINLNELIIELDLRFGGENIDSSIEQIIQSISKTKFTDDSLPLNHFFASTFFPDILSALSKNQHGLKYAFAFNNNARVNRLKAKLGVRLAGMIVKKYTVEIIEPNICLITDKFVKKWHKRGLLINTYTANTACQKDYLAQYTVAITSNCPDSICLKDESDQMSSLSNWCKKCE